MAAPTNLDEYYAKMHIVRDQLKANKNELAEEGADLKDTTKADLMEWGLTETKADYEANRLTKTKGCFAALTAFDNASS